MELKYVGDKPKISQHGISFNHTKVDKYIYLTAAVELLEALSFGATETTQHLYRSRTKEFDAGELLSLLKEFCKNIDDIFHIREEKSNEFIVSLIHRVEENNSLNDDEKKAWLKNIEIMRDYYLQYITNESAYECALDALVDEINEAQIQTVKVPLFRNYGIVLTDLKPLLEKRKSPIDMNISVDMTNDSLLATITFLHQKKISW